MKNALLCRPFTPASLVSSCDMDWYQFSPLASFNPLLLVIRSDDGIQLMGKLVKHIGNVLPYSYVRPKLKPKVSSRFLNKPEFEMPRPQYGDKTIQNTLAFAVLRNLFIKVSVGAGIFCL